MTDRADTQRCAVCGTTEGPFERHHIALRTRHETATVLLCRPCHPQQTARQRDAGLIGPRSTPSGESAVTLFHALTEGLAGILTDHARRAGLDQLVALHQQSRRATLRLLAQLSDDLGSLGPRPITNDRRSRRRQASNTSAPMPSVADSLPALAGILPALVSAISTPPRPGAAALLPGSTKLLRGFTVDDAARLFTPAGADRLARGLAALEDHPRVGKLAVIIERMSTLGFVLCDQLAKATAADGLGKGEIDTDRLVQLGRAFYEDARSTVDFALSLTTGADPVEALDRFLDRADERDDGDRRPIA
jgi:hypothetical protein